MVLLALDCLKLESPMSANFDLSIIMVVKNEAKSLARSIPAIATQETSQSYEVIVIDSGSTDGSLTLVKEQQRRNPNWRLVEILPTEFHHAKTRNLGVSRATGQRIVFLGGDAIPADTHWLARLIEPVKVTPADRIVASYGRQLPKEDADAANICRMSYNYGERSFVKDQEANLSSKERYFFSTVNCCINKTFLSLPLFDESFPVDEDVTLSARIINSGMRIAYVAEAAVLHSHNYGPRDVLRRGFDNGVVYQRLGIFHGAGRSVRKDGFRYLKQAREKLRGRPLSDWIQFVGFFLCTAIGVQLGIHHRRLPRFAGKVLSRYGTV